MNDIEKIIEKYDFVNSNIGDKRYFHLNSIRNFIIHFEYFASYTEKYFVTDLINKYLDFLIEKIYIDQDEAKKIFYEYIEPIGAFYSKRLGFRLYISFPTYLFFILFAFISFYILKLGILFYVFTILILLSHYGAGYLKFKKNKVFGFDF